MLTHAHIPILGQTTPLFKGKNNRLRFTQPPPCAFLDPYITFCNVFKSSSFLCRDISNFAGYLPTFV